MRSTNTAMEVEMEIETVVFRAQLFESVVTFICVRHAMSCQAMDELPPMRGNAQRFQLLVFAGLHADHSSKICAAHAISSF